MPTDPYDIDPVYFRLIADGGDVLVAEMQPLDEYDYSSSAFVSPHRYETVELAQAAIEQTYKQTIYPDPRGPLTTSRYYTIYADEDGRPEVRAFTVRDDYHADPDRFLTPHKYDSHREAQTAMENGKVIDAYPEHPFTYSN